MIAQPWIINCDRCPKYQIFPSVRPQKITDPDRLYMEMGEIPTEPVSREDVINEFVKQGWMIDEKNGELCPSCASTRSKK